MAGIKQVFDQLPDLRRRPDRRGHGQQRRLAATGSATSRSCATIGPHFTINRMLTFDSVKLRLEREQPLTLPRVQLHAHAGLRLPRAGAAPRLHAADGRLGPVGQHRQRRRAGPPHRRPRAVRPDHAADHHRLGRQDGQDGGRRGLAERRRCCRAYDYWQFWRNTEDADVGRFLRLFTELPLDEIARLERLQGAEINEAKKVLANEATAPVPRRAGRRRRRTRPRADLRRRRSAARTCRRSRSAAAELTAGLPAIDLFRRAGLAATNGEARRLIQGGGARVNDVAIADETHPVTVAISIPSGRSSCRPAASATRWCAAPDPRRASRLSRRTGTPPVPRAAGTGFRGRSGSAERSRVRTPKAG